jgi:HEAT repeat protein
MLRSVTCLVLLTAFLGLVGASVPPAQAADKLSPPLKLRRDTLDHYVEDLVKYLQSSSVFDRQEAEKKLAELGPKARGAVPALIELLQGKDLDKKHRACYLLANVGADAKPAVPWLIKILEGPQYPSEFSDTDVSNLHGCAADALGNLGADAKEALPALTKIMQDKNSQARVCAVKAIFYITKDRDKVLPVFHEILKTPGISGRLRAAYFFKRFAPDFKQAHAALLEIIRNPKEDAYLVPVAAHALWKAAKHPEAIPKLLELLKSSPAGDWDAAEYLAEIGPPAKAAVPLLIDKVRESSKEPKFQPGKLGLHQYQNRLARLGVWIRCLAQFGPEAKEAVPVLEPLLLEANFYLQREAARALWQIAKSEKALDHLKKEVQEGGPIGCLEATRILHELGQLPKEAVPLVVELLRHQDFEVRDDAATLLKLIDPEMAKKYKIE